MMYSVITPVYRNAEFVPLLLSEFARIDKVIQQQFGIQSEFIFVVDCSPDASYALLEESLPLAPFPSQLILHARNVGSFAAIRTGLQAARGDYVGIIAADLQEPTELLLAFLKNLITEASDIVVGVRQKRDDPASSRFAANLFWNIYRRLVIREIPPGGVDVFGCNRKVRDELLKLEESHSSLVGQLFWLGFRRDEIEYVRLARAYGASAWTLRRKISYLLDSVFAFTNLPIQILTLVGILGMSFSLVFGGAIIILRLTTEVAVPGYAATIAVIIFFGALNTLGIGVVGAYTWRSYENSKRRPLAVIQSARSFEGSAQPRNRQNNEQNAF